MKKKGAQEMSRLLVRNFTSSIHYFTLHFRYRSNLNFSFFES